MKELESPRGKMDRGMEDLTVSPSTWRSSSSPASPGWWEPIRLHLLAPLRPLDSAEKVAQVQFSAGLILILTVLGSIAATGNLLRKLDNPAAHLAWGVEMSCVLGAGLCYLLCRLGKVNQAWILAVLVVDVGTLGAILTHPAGTSNEPPPQAPPRFVGMTKGVAQ